MIFSLARATASAALLCLFVDSSVAQAQTEEKFTPKERINRIHDLSKRNGDAVPALAAYLADGDRDIRVEAVKGIVKIGGQPSLTPLVKAAHDNDSEIQIRETA